ncbi:MAG: ABC transporter ATP-binding protein [Spirochaetaceae bacterium]|nr:MAG: ABC transporter ATP-binding protein [Spirochaetaceae bacterium]
MMRERKKGNFRRILDFIRPRAVMYFAGMLGGTLLYALISVLQSFTMRNIINAITASPADTELLFSSCVIFVSIVFVLSVPFLLTRWWYNANAKRAYYDLQTGIFRHVANLPVGYFEKRHSGDIVSRMTNDVNAIGSIYGGRLRRFVAPAVNAIAYGTGMVFLDWRLGGILIIYNVVIGSVNLLFSAPIRKLSDRIQKSLGSITERLVDILSSFQVIRMFHLEEKLSAGFEKPNQDVTVQSIRRSVVTGSLDSTIYLMRMFSSIGMIAAGVFLLAVDFTDLGTLLALITLQSGFNWCILSASQHLPLLQEALAGAERAFELFDEESGTAADPAAFVTASTIKASAEEKPGIAFKVINLKNVTFSYDRERKEALCDVTMSIPRDSVTALVGPSGGGKSTILKLLLGFYTPDSGSIEIDGQPLHSRAGGDLAGMAYVSQESFLFDGTIEENIRYGKLDASTEEIQHAASLAHAHDFIWVQPDGYLTQIGERGLKLSGGQKQRIAIARAILKNAPILLLDEATSALDSESETLIQDALERLMKDRTTVVVAHRLSTIRHADKIYVINRGRIAEHGRHDELLAQDGLYTLLHELQFSM